MSSTGAPSRIIGSWTKRWKSLTSASAICASACPYTRTSCRKATSGSPASSTAPSRRSSAMSSSERCSSDAGREAGRRSRCGGSAPARARSRARRRRGRTRRRPAAGRGPRGSRRRAGPPWPRARSWSRLWPRWRMRATIRAWASAAGVQSPSRSGTMPSATQRRSVAGETESARATSVSVSSAAIRSDEREAAGPRPAPGVRPSGAASRARRSRGTGRRSAS